MNPRVKKRLLVVVLIALYVAAGFYREFIFGNINEQIRVTYDTVYRHQPTYSYVAPSMQWLAGYSYYTLYYSKWVLTLLSAFFFAFLATRIIKNAFTDKGLIRITWLAYAFVFVVGWLFYLGGALSGNIGSTYDIARFLAGLTETPVLLLVLCASFLAIGRR